MTSIGLFLCRTQNLILANARNSRILIGPGNAKNLKEVSPSSMSFRYAPSFTVRGFGVKKLKMTTMRSHDASLRDFFARRYHVYLTTNFSKAASRVTDDWIGNGGGILLALAKVVALTLD